MRLFFGLRPSLSIKQQIDGRQSEVHRTVKQAWGPLENLHYSQTHLVPGIGDFSLGMIIGSKTGAKASFS